MKINVTLKHLALGVPKVCTACPVVYALEESGFSGVFADENWLKFTDRRLERRKVVTPPIVYWFMETFDDPETRHLAKPFDFDMEF